MAHATVINAARDQQILKFWVVGEYLVTHEFNHIPSFLASEITEPLIHNGHKFLTVHIPDHIHGSILWSRVPVVVGLPVVTLGTHIRLCVKVTAQMDAYPVRASNIEAKE